MDIEQCIVLTLIVLVSGIVSVVGFGSRFSSKVGLITVLVNSLLTSIPSVMVLGGTVLKGTFLLPHYLGEVAYSIDGLSAWFILIINFTAINGALYGNAYLQAYSNLKTNTKLHWVVYQLFHASMLWVCMMQNGIAFLVSWELMSLSSLLLVIFEFQNKSTLRAGLNYLVQMHVSVVFLTIGFIWLFFNTNSFNFQALANLPETQHSLWIFAMLFVGFAIKAGFLPFHTWLPEAHPAAPSHVSGVMSGVIVKLGIYGILRIISYTKVNWNILGEIILSLSILTAIYGILNALVKRDFKRMLAYCTIENIGIIGIGIGLGLIGRSSGNPTLMLIGFTAALLHCLNHSLYKSLLFFCAGNIYQYSHSRKIDHLGGLIKKMPITALAFLFGSIAIVGLPPLNGFISEYLLYSGLFKSLNGTFYISEIVLFVLTIAGLALVAGISLFTFTKSFGMIFLGNPRHEIHSHKSHFSFLHHLPLYLIIIAILSIAFIPNFFLIPISKIVFTTFNTDIHLNPNDFQPFFNNFSTIGKVSLVFSLVFGVAFFMRWLLVRNKPSTVYETWSCGYTAPIPKAQYTGKSFARTVAQLFSFVIKEEKKKKQRISKTELYPEKHTFSTKYADVIEKYFVTNISKRIAFTLHYFKFIQNGQIQSYIIYGLVFILLIYFIF